MIKAKIVSPCVAILECDQETLKKIKKTTSYTNTSNDFQYKKHLKNYRWKSSNFESWSAHGEELKKSIYYNLVWEYNGKIYIRPGYLPYLAQTFDISIENEVKYPEPRPYVWYRKPKFEPYPYQSECVENLIKEKHGNVSHCTAAGKSKSIEMITQRLGLKTIITTPSVSIFNELLERFQHSFGTQMVGALGGGKRKLNKPIIVCVADSLVNIKQETKEYEEFSNADVLIVDESHQFSSVTLEKVCHNLLKNIPYRFYFSGTQTRTDGTEKLLRSIIGKTVHTLTTKDALAGGYVCDHEFRIVPVTTTNPNFYSKDALAMKRKHFLQNQNIADFIAKLATADATINKKQTLVLVDEMVQISMLYKLLQKNNIPTEIAHSESDQERLLELGLYKVDSAASVEKFNKGEAMVLIGSSAIATGTNIFPTHNCVNWVGGTSEIKTKQGAIGRAVRKQSSSPYDNPNHIKTKSIIWDFDIIGIEEMSRHLKARISIYEENGVPIIFYGQK